MRVRVREVVAMKMLAVMALEKAGDVLVACGVVFLMKLVFRQSFVAVEKGDMEDFINVT